MVRAGVVAILLASSPVSTAATPTGICAGISATSSSLKGWHHECLA